MTACHLTEAQMQAGVASDVATFKAYIGRDPDSDEMDLIVCTYASREGVPEDAVRLATMQGVG